MTLVRRSDREADWQWYYADGRKGAWATVTRKLLGSCQGEQCNGLDPYWSRCYLLARSVKELDIQGPGFDVAMTLSIKYAPNCNAYYGQMDSYRLKRRMLVTITRGGVIRGPHWQDKAFTIRSVMFGKNGMQVSVHGCYTDHTHCYTITTS